jgi:hypothetical protein
MDLHANKVWLPGAASCLLFFGLCFMFPAYTNFGRYGFLFISIPYLAVMPFVGALGAYLSRRMKVQSLSASCPHCSPYSHLLRYLP